MCVWVGVERERERGGVGVGGWWGIWSASALSELAKGCVGWVVEWGGGGGGRREEGEEVAWFL